jgi:hypothetical protein
MVSLLVQWKIEYWLCSTLRQNELHMALLDLILCYAASLHGLGDN